MINVDGADAYFAGRTMRKAWEEFTVDQREAAILQAKRDFSRALGRPMNEDEGSYVFGQQTRDEYAVYEQALYALLRDVQPEGTGTDIPSIEPDEKQSHGYTLKTGKGKWSEEALAWLGATGRVETVMG